MQVAQGEHSRQRSRKFIVPLPAHQTPPPVPGAFPLPSPLHAPASPLPYLCAGGPSMMMLIHRICIALRGLGRLHTVDRVMRLKAEMLLQGTHRALSRAAPRPGTRGEAGLDLRAQLKSDKVLDVIKNPLAFLHRIPAREEKAFIHQDGRERRVSQLPSPAKGSDGVTKGHVSPWWHSWGITSRGYADVLTGAFSHWGLVAKSRSPFCPKTVDHSLVRALGPQSSPKAPEVPPAPQ